MFKYYYSLFIQCCLGTVLLTGCGNVISYQANGLQHAIIERSAGFPAEKLFICFGATEKTETLYNKTIAFLKKRNAQKINNTWVINDANKKKTYEIKLLTDIEDVSDALMTEDAHVVISAHANFGLGPVLKKKSDDAQDIGNILKKIRYIDDERILNIGSKWIDLPVYSVRVNNKLANFWPKFKDGSSGIAPYNLENLDQSPPYNYYLTYQVSGESSFFKILDKNGNPIQRFPASGREPWYSKEGIEPDASNPAHRKYFIVNREQKKNYFKKFGEWKTLKSPKGYYGENYLKMVRGGKANRTEWHFEIPSHGTYDILTWWPSQINEVSRASYSLKKKGSNGKLGFQKPEKKLKSYTFPEKMKLLGSGQKNGAVDGLADQQTMICNQNNVGNQWHQIGSYELATGNYILTQKATGTGDVTIADAIRIINTDDPEDTFQPFFFSNKQNLELNELVIFTSNSMGNIKEYKWDFGDGNKIKTHKRYVFYQYRKPGIYDVSLEVLDFNENSLKRTKKQYIAVENDEPIFGPEFTGKPTKGPLNLKVCFQDQSRGKITKYYWNFGDGNKSTEANPEHVYRKIGNYTVSLTIINSDGKIKKNIKEQFIKIFNFDTIIDNIDYPKPHYASYTIINNRNSLRFRYKRLFLDSCNVQRYFLETLNHGIVFYTTGASNGFGLFPYLDSYLGGKNDREILTELDKFQPNGYSYYDFNRKPQEYQSRCLTRGKDIQNRSDLKR